MSSNDYMYAPHCAKCGTQVGAPRLVPEDYKPVRTLCSTCPGDAKPKTAPDLWGAILAAAKSGMPLDEMRDKLKSCGYELCTKRVYGSSENPLIESALQLYNDLKARGWSEAEIQEEMTMDEWSEDEQEWANLPEFIDGQDFFKAAMTAVRNSTITIWCRKIKDQRQNFPKAMRLLGSPLEEVTQ